MLAFGKIVLAQCIVIGCTVAVVSADVALLSSTFNDHVADNALDGNPYTCAQTGVQRGAWWVLRLDTPQELAQVTITGNITNFDVRVGYDFNSMGRMGGFEDNALCVFRGRINIEARETFTCPYPLPGDIISIHLVDALNLDGLILCEVSFEFSDTT